MKGSKPLYNKSFTHPKSFLECYYATKKCIIKKIPISLILITNANTNATPLQKPITWDYIIYSTVLKQRCTALTFSLKYQNAQTKIFPFHKDI